jgi:predicted aspartyl protease
MRSPARLLPLAFSSILGLMGATPLQAQTVDPNRCMYINVATLPLKYSGPDLGITTEGRIDGKPATLLVDTGAWHSVLTRTGAERHKLRLRHSNESARGVGGYTRIYNARVKEFATGPAVMQGGYLRVIGDTASPPSHDGIAGAPFLLQADLEFSLATKEIRFFRPRNCDKQFLAYWDENAVEVPFESSFSTSPNPEFNVLVNGKKFRAIIDSGAAFTVFTLDGAKRAGLKLDAPGVERAGSVSGVGTERVARWTAVFDTLQIGAEIIRNAEVGVIDTDNLRVDLLLGADFLRSHRVLFAMSQEKLYISYIGGEPLGQRRKIEAWMQQEADAGNADAQLHLAMMYMSRKHADADQAKTWMERAAAGGSPQANAMTGQRLLRQGRHQEAAERLRKAVDTLPSARHTALWLYAARAHTGQAELGKRELAAVFEHEIDEWPGPIASYYLGKMDEEELLEEARDDGKRAKANVCLARMHIAERRAFEGDSARLEAARAQQKVDCAREQPAGK